jgi:hypothetical protein
MIAYLRIRPKHRNSDVEKQVQAAQTRNKAV